MDKLIRTLLYGVNGTFVWKEHMGKIAGTALASMIPAFEGRYALAVAQGIGMPALPALLIAFVMSSIPMPFIFWLLRPILDLLYRLPIRPVRAFAAWVDRKVEQKKGKVSRKGLVGLYLFVAIPLPGTGVWTGSAIATVLKMDKRRASVAILLGNLTACVIMTVLSYLGVKVFS